ncbi:MAG: hypothetical protein H0W81_02005 [Chloroflexi bacterium]|nr:hypothetical protein [Chloroflexota bacterium]
MTGRTPPRRTDDESLELALRLADSIAASGVLGIKSTVAIHGGGGPIGVRITEPPRAQVRDALVDLRKFDSRGEDVYIPSLHALLLKRARKPGWDAGFREARKAYAAAQEPRDIKVVDPDEPVLPDGGENWIKPPEAWRLWVYVEHLHNDYDRELRYKRFDPLTRGVIQAMARDYNAVLVEQVAYIGKLIRHGLA